MNACKRNALIVAAAFLIYSCGATDGGSRGTGITSLAQGNVASVNSSSSSVNGITVSVEGKPVHGTTQPNGSFKVRGVFEGQVTLVFTRQSDGVQARAPINLPAAGKLTLNNVRIDNGQGTATADSENVDFLGAITQVDCAGQNLTLVAKRHAPYDKDSYTVRLDTSTLQDSSGKAVNCTQLRNGETARVQGIVNSDGSYGHAVVVVQDEP